MINTNPFTTKIKMFPKKKYADLKLFETPSNLPFLWYKKVGEYTTNFANLDPITHPKMSLEFGLKPIINQPTLEELWPIEKNENIQRAHKHEFGRIFAANILCNSIARKSRRAYGNILIVPNEAERMWFAEKYVRFNYKISVFVDSSLEPNELRATYWKIHLDQMGTPGIVDGGIQVSPEGVSCIQKNDDTMFNYSDYFARGFT